MVTMTDSDRDVIRRFAAGDNFLREQAIAIYRAHAATAPGAPEVLFMAEVASLAPDHLLRAKYRRQLRSLAEAGV